MKIDGPGRPGETAKAKTARKSSPGEGRFGDFLTGGSGESAGAGATQSIASLDSLLALQGAEDPAQRAARNRMRARGENILSELDKIRTGLLTGTLTVGHIVDIADVIASRREKIMDPALNALMDEVDLRAQVELAKLRVALDRKTAVS